MPSSSSTTNPSNYIDGKDPEPACGIRAALVGGGTVQEILLPSSWRQRQDAIRATLSSSEKRHPHVHQDENRVCVISRADNKGPVILVGSAWVDGRRGITSLTDDQLAHAAELAVAR
ncbi:hypothetical protein [Streptomyces sp. NPDC002402]